MIRSKQDVSHYFVVNTWKENPVIYLIRRNSEEARELAEIEMPETVKNEFFKSNGHLKGVFAVDGKVKLWLRNKLGNA